MVEPLIDPTARVHPSAVLGSGVKIGPFCVVGEDVELGANCHLISHCCLDGPSTFGHDNVFHPFSTIGLVAADKKYQGERAQLVVGNHNQFREYANVHRGTAAGGMVTRIGSHNLLMPMSHVAHDCVLGDHNVIANYTGLSGHCVLGSYATLAANSVIHQQTRIGDYAFVGMCSAVNADVPPYVMAYGNPARFLNVNRVGLDRANWTGERIQKMKIACKLLLRGRYRREVALKKLQTMVKDEPAIQLLIDFVGQSERGLIRAE
ncbi:MAG: acyl-ACP--UDP-N-acetylglucosamine O-acyltransferase [Gammaproteobacteria bacterium]